MEGEREIWTKEGRGSSVQRLGLFSSMCLSCILYVNPEK